MKSILTALLLTASVLHAQTITWTDVTSSYPSIPGVKVYSGTKPSSSSFYAYYFDVDMNRPDVALRPYITSSPASLPELLKRTGAYAAINGGFFGGTTSYSSVVYPDEVKAQNVPVVTRSGSSYPLIRSFFGVRADRSMAVDWIYHFGPAVSDIYKFDAPLPYAYNDPSPKPAPSKSEGTQYLNLLTGLGGGPTLVKNGAENLTYNEEIMWGSGVDLSAAQFRTAVGYTPDNHAILFCSSPLPLSELPSIFIGLGCTEAMNLDGGGSTQMSIGTQNLVASSRALPVIFAIVHPDSIGIPDTPVFEKVIDTGDDGVNLSGSWIASANAGYYGSTPAMICGVGDGSSAAEFTLNPPASALYEVYGWWVSSSNRAKDTPFIINHKNGTDTIYADQTADGSAWKLIGKYTFSGDSTDKVIITNGAKTGSYVVADAVKIVSYDAVTGLKEETVSENISVPADYELLQNYPNPFNPETTIRYNLPKESRVKITIYNSIGEVLTTLGNRVQNAGYHEVNFNAGNISSGLYFYKMTAAASDGSEQYSVTKKMLLLK